MMRFARTSGDKELIKATALKAVQMLHGLPRDKSDPVAAVPVLGPEGEWQSAGFVAQLTHLNPPLVGKIAMMMGLRDIRFEDARLVKLGQQTIDNGMSVPAIFYRGAALRLLIEACHAYRSGSPNLSLYDLIGSQQFNAFKLLIPRTEN